MLIYNKLKDPYHTLLRLLKILDKYNDKEEISHERLRIYDFLLANPYEIFNIRLQRSGKTYFKKFKNTFNIYDKTTLFFNLESIQKTSIQYLIKNNILIKLQHDEIYKINKNKTFKELIALLTETNSISEKALGFIISNLNTIPLHREGGLKDRTGLLGYKYDARN